MNPSRNYQKAQHNLPGARLAAAAMAWLALAGVWPARADTAPGEEEKARTYTLAEETIRRARENLSKQVSTESPELTTLVHDLYSHCTFDKLWEPALPGLPYRFFSISGADDTSYAKCQLLWDTMFVLNAWAPLDDDPLACDVLLVAARKWRKTAGLKIRSRRCESLRSANPLTARLDPSFGNWSLQ